MRGHLEDLKERLKRKPEVKPNQGVRIVLAPSDAVAPIAPVAKQIITAERDEGKRAQDILEKIKQKKLSTVIKRLPEKPKEEILPPKAPQPIPEKKKKSKKKIDTKKK